MDRIVTVDNNEGASTPDRLMFVLVSDDVFGWVRGRDYDKYRSRRNVIEGKALPQSPLNTTDKPIVT